MSVLKEKTAEDIRAEQEHLPVVTVRLLGEDELREGIGDPLPARMLRAVGRLCSYFFTVFREISIPSKVITLLSALTVVYGFIPLFTMRTLNIGSLIILMIGLYFGVTAMFTGRLLSRRKKWINFSLSVLGILVTLFFILSFYISGLMVAAASRTPPPYKTRVTAIVLGCKVRGSTPSLMLEGRLEEALAYLKQNPEAYCIVSGGQGPDEDFAEADIMKDYLVERGISPGRIVAERESSSTAENISFSAAMIGELGLYSDVVIITDRFHQYRTSLLTEKAGLISYTRSRDTAWHLVGHYWFREIAGICKIAIFGDDAYS